MEAINLSAIAANVGGVIVAGLAMLGYLRKTIRSEAQSVVDNAAVSQEDFRSCMESITKRFDDHDSRLKHTENFKNEFGILKANQLHMQSDVAEIKQDVKALSGEITGAITRVAEMAGKMSR